MLTSCVMATCRRPRRRWPPAAAAPACLAGALPSAHRLRCRAGAAAAGPGRSRWRGRRPTGARRDHAVVVGGDLDRVGFQHQVADGEDQAVGADHHAGAAALPPQGFGGAGAFGGRHLQADDRLHGPRERVEVAWLRGRGAGGLRGQRAGGERRAQRRAGAAEASRDMADPREVLRQECGKRAAGARRASRRPTRQLQRSAIFCIIRRIESRGNSVATYLELKEQAEKLLAEAERMREQEIADAIADIRKRSSSMD